MYIFFIYFNLKKITAGSIKTVIIIRLKAKRPKNSLLDTNKIEKALNIELPYWESEFYETIDQILEE